MASKVLVSSLGQPISSILRAALGTSDMDSLVGILAKELYTEKLSDDSVFGRAFGWIIEVPSLVRLPDE